MDMDVGGPIGIDKYDRYRHLAEQCEELSRTMDSPRDRSIMLQMALVWSRLAEYAAKTVASEGPAEPELSD